MDSTDDFLSRAVLFLDDKKVKEIISKSDKIMEPKWFKVSRHFEEACKAHRPEENKDDPQILVSL
jgi:hypothetical protein